MAQAQHLHALQKKHAALEEKIHKESIRPARNDIVIRRLKEQKLHLKEEIAEIERHHAN